MTLLSYEYIRGLIDGEGCFTFSSTPNKTGKVKLPAFILRMCIRDKALIESVRDTLKLKNKIYTYHYRYKDADRQPQSILIVRDFGSLKSKIIPLFYKKLHGYKRIQFEEWINLIEQDPLVSKDYKLLPKLYKNGYFDQITSFN